MDTTATDVVIRLLGPVAVLTDGAARPVQGLRRGAVLAALALRPGEVVGIERLADIVWDHAAPKTATQTLRSHLSYIRRRLPGRASIVARSAGYVLNLAGTTTTDVAAAEQLIGQADECRDSRRRKALLQVAVAQWTAPPLADLTTLDWFDIQAQRLDQLLLHAQGMLITTRMELGEHQQVLPLLEQLCRQDPLNEQLHGHLMLALYRCGRQADALATYHSLRRNLDEELGVGPGPAVRDLETAILRQDGDLDLVRPAGSVALAAQAWVTPAQLPRPVPAFGGRRRELRQLRGHLPLPGGEQSTPPETTISLITGTAGVGKTALAIQWAHQIKARFPDGQLYVNLRGFDPSGSVKDPSEAVRGLLDTLGVPAGRIPATLEGQVTLYRSVLAGKRVLVVVDNARDEQQVRPLLPGAPGCLVLVTSRNQLPGLVAAEGARSLILHRPSLADARQMLAGRLGADRVEAEPQAVDEIITRCARLPLALAIAAGRAALDPRSPLSRLAAQLRDTAAEPLDSFDNADPATNIRAVFSWSYRILSDQAARLFRLLSLCPAPDLAAPAVASVAGLPRSTVRPLLAELVRAGLLIEPGPDRFGFHELLRAYAIEQARRFDSDGQQAAARRRYLDHYLHTAYAGTLLLKPSRDPIDMAAAAPGVTPEAPATLDAVLTWFTQERSALLATMTRQPDGFETHSWQLAWALMTFLRMHGYQQDNVLVQRAGLICAERIGDPIGLAYAHRSLGKAYIEMGAVNEAQPHNQQALRLFEAAGNRVAVADIFLNLSMAAEQRGDIPRALADAGRAYRVYRSAGHLAGQACAANAVGWYHGRLGDHEQGLASCREAMAAFTTLNDVEGIAGTWDSLGALYFGLGDRRQGDACYRNAIALYQRLGSRYLEADAYISLGNAHAEISNPDAANSAWNQALAILDDVDPAAAASIRSRLDATRQTPPAQRVGGRKRE